MKTFLFLLTVLFFVSGCSTFTRDIVVIENLNRRIGYIEEELCKQSKMELHRDLMDKARNYPYTNGNRITNEVEKIKNNDLLTTKQKEFIILMFENLGK